MLSDKGIRQATEEGTLTIEPFDRTCLGACSYDLTTARIWQRKVPHRAPSYADEAEPLERFLENDCEPYDGVLLPSRLYIGVSREKVGAVVPFDVTTRSSAARLGIETHALNKPEIASGGVDNVYFTIRTRGTICRVKEGESLSQVVPLSGLPLSAEEIEELIESGGFRIDGRYDPAIVYFNTARFGFAPTPHMALMRLGSGLKEYDGKELDFSADNEAHFSEIELPEDQFYQLAPGAFYIGHTEETIELPRNCAGMLRKLPNSILWGDVHPNAPLIAAGSKGQQILELHYPEGFLVRSGMPICGMEIWRLDQEPENAYNGRYLGQSGPQTSLSHL